MGIGKGGQKIIFEIDISNWRRDSGVIVMQIHYTFKIDKGAEVWTRILER